MLTTDRHSAFNAPHLRYSPAQAAAVTSAPKISAKPRGDISSVFPSLSGITPPPLPERFAELKKSIAGGKEDALEQSWHRLLKSLERRVKEVREFGSAIIPDVSYNDVVNNTVPPETIKKIKEIGSCVIRGVIPPGEARGFKDDIEDYVSANEKSGRVRAFPKDSPAVYELYWTPSQVKARSHPNMLKAQTFLQSLWHSSSPDTTIATSIPTTYADRLRIRQPGDSKFALGPHVDGGSLERWEDPTYRSVYQAIFDGNWEEYDAFDTKHRVNAVMDLYNSAGGCAMFRMFQGWLAMSETGPGEGTLKVNPMLKETTAYFLLRPFFDEADKLFKGEAWPTEFQGAVMASMQELNDGWHPHLHLDDTMVSMPKVQPGDYVAWHCDAIHSVDKEHRGTGDSSVLYIPVAPLCGLNAKYLRNQRQCAASLTVPPDFPGAGVDGEYGFEGAVNWDQVESSARIAMGMEKGWEVEEWMSEGEKRAIREANAVLFGEN